MQALLRHHREELAAAAALAEAHTDDDLPARLRATLDAWLAHVESHPYTWRMLFRDTTGDPDIQAVHRQLHEAQRATDVELLRLAALHLPEEELPPLGEVIRSSLVGLALWRLEHPDTPRTVLVASMLRVGRGPS